MFISSANLDTQKRRVNGNLICVGEIKENPPTFTSGVQNTLHIQLTNIIIKEHNMNINKDYLKIIASLIRSHYEKNEEEFKRLVTDIAHNLDEQGRNELSEYLLAQIGLFAWTVND